MKTAFYQTHTILKMLENVRNVEKMRKQNETINKQQPTTNMKLEMCKWKMENGKSTHDCIYNLITYKTVQFMAIMPTFIITISLTMMSSFGPQSTIISTLKCNNTSMFVKIINKSTKNNTTFGKLLFILILCVFPNKTKPLLPLIGEIFHKNVITETR